MASETPLNGKQNGVANAPPEAALDPYARAKETTDRSGRIRVDDEAKGELVGAAVRRAGVHGESPIDPADPADARLLASGERADERVADATQRAEQDEAALRQAEANRDAVGPAPTRPAAPWLVILVLGLASGMISTVTFHNGFGMPAFPTNPAKAILFGLVFGLSVTFALVGAPFKAATYHQQTGLWRWAPLLAGTAGFAWGLYLIRNAQSVSGHAVSLGLALMEGIVVLVAECVAHAYGVAWAEYRTLTKAYAKAEAFVVSARRQLEESRQALADAEAKQARIDGELADRQVRARRAERAMASAGHAAAEGVTAAVEGVRGRVFGNTWANPTEAEALERLVGKKQP